MIPFQLHRRIPLMRRPFFQRDRALSERNEALARGDRAEMERDAALVRVERAEAERDAVRADRDRLSKQLDSPPGTEFIEVELPDETRYELNVTVAGQDVYHDSISHAGYDLSWHFLYGWLRPGDVLFDLGANIGTISILAAVRGAVVHAFELLAANVQHLVASVQRNQLRRVSIVLGAVSDSAGVLGIGGYSAWGQTVADALVSIPTIVIDAYVQQKKIGLVDIIKLDVEGSEIRALRGSVGLIERDHPDIVLECNAVTCGNHGYSYRELLQLLAEHGYSLYRLHHPQRLCPCAADVLQEVVYADYLATTKDPAVLAARSGWSVYELSNEEIILSIMSQDPHGDIHKQYVLEIANQLPEPLRNDGRISSLLEKWAGLREDRMAAILQTGSA